ncbi:MAG: hypothetical protein H2184_16645 [Candidatus Galacturonibacter soehngenii]|nr:hypothetical protein [Candidatus Galacturonibacter soehngenii]
MENWLHFGIKKNDIKAKYEEIYNLEFPNTPEDDELYDLYAELVEIDMSIMGVVSKYIKKDEIDISMLKCDDEFNEMLNEISSEKEGINELLYYKSKLDSLIDMFMVK